MSSFPYRISSDFGIETGMPSLFKSVSVSEPHLWVWIVLICAGAGGQTVGGDSSFSIAPVLTQTHRISSDFETGVE